MKDYIAVMQRHMQCEQAYTIHFHQTTYQVVVDGELYHTGDIYTQLRQRYPLQDCAEEIVFYAYMEWNEAAFTKLEGAYSFLLAYDDTFIVYKDPLGLSPVFYTQYADALYVSNRIETLLKTTNMPRILNQSGVLELFAFGPSLSPNKTLFANISALPMGSCLRYHTGKITVNTYYELPVIPHSDDLTTTAAKVHDLLERSIQQQADGAQASFLSGGLDSSIITAVCAKQAAHWRTYSLDYEGNRENFHHNVYQVSMDNAYIKEMLDRYPCDHTWCLLKQETLAQHLEDAMLARDHPGMADVDASLLWLCEQVAQKETVILSGECSDEIFGGYPWFYRDELKDLTTFPWLRSTSKRIELLRKELRSLDYEGYIAQQYVETTRHVRYLECDNEDDKRARRQTQLCLQWFMQTLVTRQVCEGDRAGLTIRAPFANVKLLEYVYNIPWTMKFYQGQEKGILRKAFANELPDDICWRKKNPFPKTHHPRYADIAAAMLQERYEDIHSPLHTLLDDDALRELIDSKGASFRLPWYGQLMSGPQLLAYLYQIDCWIRDYHIEIQL